MNRPRADTIASVISVSSTESNEEIEENILEPVLKLKCSHRLSVVLDDELHHYLEVKGEFDDNGDYPVAQAQLAVANDVATVPDSAIMVSCSGIVTYSRPQFVAARIDKDSPDTKVGLYFRRYRTGTFISKISSDSPFANTDLRVGDKVISINSINSQKLSAHECASLVKNAEKTLTICVSNNAGDPNLVSSSVRKPGEKVGIRMKRARGMVTVKSIDSESPFLTTLLMPEHRIMYINGISCSGMNAQDTADLIAISKEYLTIVSRPRSEVAIVLACNPHKSLWTKMAVACGLAAGALGALKNFA